MGVVVAIDDSIKKVDLPLQQAYPYKLSYSYIFFSDILFDT